MRFSNRLSKLYSKLVPANAAIIATSNLLYTVSNTISEPITDRRWIWFFEVKTSDLSRLRYRFFRGLEAGKVEVCTSELRLGRRFRDCPGGEMFDAYLLVGLPCLCLIRSISPKPFFTSSSASSFSALSLPQRRSSRVSSAAVSYTHLTLPTNSLV